MTNEELKKLIQDKMDNYSIAGGNLLCWLTETDLERAPKSFFPLRQQWEEWGNDVACRASFAMLREILEEL